MYDDWQIPLIQVPGAVHAGPLNGPGTLLCPRGVGGYTMQRDSSGTRRSAVRPGTNCVDDRRLKRGVGAVGSPIASTSTSTRATPFPSPGSVFSHGCGNPTRDP